MAGETGNAVPDLIAQIERDPSAWAFFTALRYLDAHSDGPGFGYSTSPKQDPVRLGQDASLVFAPSTISGVRRQGGGAPRLAVAFQGLLGPNAPMPLHLAEFVRQRERNHGDPTHARFLDVFHHRMLAYFYRAWADGQMTIGYESGAKDRFATRLASLIGMGMPTLTHRDAVPDAAKLHFAGRLSALPANAEGLEAILNEHLGIAVRVECFEGHWVPLPKDQQCRLGESVMTGALGLTAIAGEKVWDSQSKFRILLGPLTLEEFEGFLPDPVPPGAPRKLSPRQRALRDWVRMYVGFEFAYDVMPILKKEEVPGSILGKAGRLGLTSWAKTREALKDATDVVLDLEQH